MSEIKYSEYILFVAATLNPKFYWICNNICQHPTLKPYLDTHGNRLLKTITIKIKKANTTTLSSFYRAKFYKVELSIEDLVLLKQEYLRNLAKIHAKKGN